MFEDAEATDAEAEQPEEEECQDEEPEEEECEDEQPEEEECEDEEPEEEECDDDGDVTIDTPNITIAAPHSVYLDFSFSKFRDFTKYPHPLPLPLGFRAILLCAGMVNSDGYCAPAQAPGCSLRL